MDRRHLRVCGLFQPVCRMAKLFPYTVQEHAKQSRYFRVSAFNGQLLIPGKNNFQGPAAARMSLQMESILSTLIFFRETAAVLAHHLALMENSKTANGTIAASVQKVIRSMRCG